MFVKIFRPLLHIIQQENFIYSIYEVTLFYL